MNQEDRSNISNQDEEIRDRSLKMLKAKVEMGDLPLELKERLLIRVERLNLLVGTNAYLTDFESTASYVDLVCSIPWNKRSPDNLDLNIVHQILDKNHYGIDIVKDRILEHLSILSLRRRNGRSPEKSEVVKTKTFVPVKAESFRASVLCFVGLPGIGKTSMAHSIAEAMDRRFVRIAMGGMGSASQLRGRARGFPASEPGMVVKNIIRAGYKNPVLLLDEIDRVADSARAEIMGVLLELLDPEQNMAFTDYYLDFPLDLSEVMFICSCNNTGGIANAVLDRLELIQMPSYTDEEKIVIGVRYLFPKELKHSGLTEDELQIEDDVWSQIIRPLGFDAGVRTLDRTIQGVCGKVARKIVMGEGKTFRITQDNVAEFLPQW